MSFEQCGGRGWSNRWTNEATEKIERVNAECEGGR